MYQTPLTAGFAIPCASLGPHVRCECGKRRAENGHQKQEGRNADDASPAFDAVMNPPSPRTDAAQSRRIHGGEACANRITFWTATSAGNPRVRPRAGRTTSVRGHRNPSPSDCQDVRDVMRRESLTAGRVDAASASIRRDAEPTSCASAHVIDRHARVELDEAQALSPGTTSKTHRSVMILFTTARPVMGQGAFGQDLGAAVLGVVVHQDDDAAYAGHEVHRAAGTFDHLAGNHPVGEVAMLPTPPDRPGWAMSMWPPRIIANEVGALEKKLAPGMAVTVCLPALMRSGSTSSSGRKLSRSPAARSRIGGRRRYPSGMWLATSVGMPMPRLT